MSSSPHPTDDTEPTPPVEDEATRVAPAPDAARMSGTVLRDRFVLEQVIGRGGMSVVYRALDRRRREAHDRHDHIAIKVLDGSFREHPDAFVALQREARRAQTLAHPNIATVYDFDREGDTPYLCMELLSGETLDQRMERSKPLPRDEAQAIIRGMVDGLEHAHRRGIVHADLKPANVFITDQGDVKLLDFGIARVVPGPSDGTETTFDAGRLGALTPAYASCEMFEGRSADPRDDVYALACVSYELLAGAHPFGRTHAPDARAAGLTPAPVPDLSAGQNQALLDGLAFDREARSASVSDFYQALFSETRDAGNAPRRKGAAGRWAIGAVGLAIAVAGSWMYLDSGGWLRESTPAAVLDPPAEIRVEDAENASADTAEELPPDEASNVPAVDAATQARIDRILDIADLHRQMGKLVAPPGTNAVEAYEEILRLQPDNARAIEGLERVGSALAQEAQQLAAMGELAEAAALVDRGLSVQPEHPELLALKARWQALDSEQ